MIHSPEKLSRKNAVGSSNRFYQLGSNIYQLLVSDWPNIYQLVDRVLGSIS